MSKYFFARIIELPQAQALITKVKTDDPNAPYAVKVETDVLGKRVAVTMGFEDVLGQEDAWKSLDMNGVTELVENMTAQVEMKLENEKNEPEEGNGE